MDRKILREIGAAAGIGAMIGMATIFPMHSRLGLELWLAVLLGSLIGAVAGGVAYRPDEAWQLIKKFALDDNGMCGVLLSEIKFASRLKKAWARTPNFIFLIGMIVLVLIIIAAVISLWSFSWGYSAGYVVSWFVQTPEIGLRHIQRQACWVLTLTFAVLVTVVTISLSGLIETLHAGNGKPSWKMPLTARLHQLHLRVDKKFSRMKINYYCLGFLVVCISPVALVQGSFLLLLIIADTAITIICALASTQRLAAMAGALIGVLMGAATFFSGLHDSPFLAEIICGVTGAYFGRWIYEVRTWLEFQYCDTQYFSR